MVFGNDCLRGQAEMVIDYESRVCRVQAAWTKYNLGNKT